jgi:hypothetical protein
MHECTGFQNIETLLEKTNYLNTGVYFHSQQHLDVTPNPNSIFAQHVKRLNGHQVACLLKHISLNVRISEVSTY